MGHRVNRSMRSFRPTLPRLYCAPKDSCDTPRKFPSNPAMLLARYLADFFWMDTTDRSTLACRVWATRTVRSNTPTWGMDSAYARRATTVEAMACYAGTMAIRRSAHARSRSRATTICAGSFKTARTLSVVRCSWRLVWKSQQLWVIRFSWMGIIVVGIIWWVMRRGMRRLVGEGIRGRRGWSGYRLACC